MAAGSLQSYVNYSCQGKVDPAKTDGVAPDDVLGPLVKVSSIVTRF